MLGVSFVVEGYSLLVATRAVIQGATAAKLGFWEFLQRGLDPTSVAVMLEDGAAVTGLLIAGKPAATSSEFQSLPVCCAIVLLEDRAGRLSKRLACCGTLKHLKQGVRSQSSRHA